MLKLNAFSKEKKRFSIRRNKPKVLEYVQNTTPVLTEVVFISSLLARLK